MLLDKVNRKSNISISFRIVSQYEIYLKKYLFDIIECFPNILNLLESDFEEEFQYSLFNKFSILSKVEADCHKIVNDLQTSIDKTDDEDSYRVLNWILKLFHLYYNFVMEMKTLSPKEYQYFIGHSCKLIRCYILVLLKFDNELSLEFAFLDDIHSCLMCNKEIRTVNNHDKNHCQHNLCIECTSAYNNSCSGTSFKYVCPFDKTAQININQ